MVTPAHPHIIGNLENRLAHFLEVPKNPLDHRREVPRLQTAHRPVVSRLHQITWKLQLYQLYLD
jgi:hypothetical protein